MICGPGCESSYNREAHRADIEYLEAISALVAKIHPKAVLVVGGAGNALPLELEFSGVSVDVVEVDPELARLADVWFGHIHGVQYIGDGRYISRALAADTYDCLILDAFTGIGVVPSHLLTKEGLGQLCRLLRTNGIIIINMNGALSGPASGAVATVARTLGSVVRAVRVVPVQDKAVDSRLFQNVLLLGGAPAVGGLGLEYCPANGPIATDDKNPLDLLFLRALQYGQQGVSALDAADRWMDRM
jgi:spermidine synthase